jgi:hypothetical protein
MAAGNNFQPISSSLRLDAGRRFSGAGLEELDLDRSGPYLRIDDRCRTSMRGIYAIGDVTGEPMLAHRAMAQGEMVAEIIAGRKRSWDKRCIPAVCFTDPEIVTSAYRPTKPERRVYDIRIGQFPFTASGRAMTMQSEDGFVRVVARADTNLVLGLQAVGRGVSELSADLFAGDRNVCPAGGYRRHHPCTPHSQRRLAGSGPQSTRPPAASCNRRQLSRSIPKTEPLVIHIR